MKEKILQLLKESDGFVSGQQISDRFGVSRTSIWKAVRQLTDMGYEIEAVRNRGYRLLSEPDLLTEDSVEDQLQTEWAGRPVLVLDLVDSTNNEVKRRAEDGAAEGMLVISEEQTAGRGRRGRIWSSERGSGIFMSLLLRPDIEPGRASMLTLVMGMAVRDAIEEICSGSEESGEGGPKEPAEGTGISDLADIRIKWPNDIICDNKKVSGILTEMSAEPDCIHYVVIGIGINVHNPDFSGETAETAVSLYQQTGTHFSRAGLIALCMKRFEEYAPIFFETQDMSGLMDRYNAFLINRGREVRAFEGEREYVGTARGINSRGELLVDTPEGTKAVSAGEVSVRGVCGYV